MLCNNELATAIIGAVAGKVLPVFKEPGSIEWIWTWPH